MALAPTNERGANGSTYLFVVVLHAGGSADRRRHTHTHTHTRESARAGPHTHTHWHRETHTHTRLCCFGVSLTTSVHQTIGFQRRPTKRNKWRRLRPRRRRRDGVAMPPRAHTHTPTQDPIWLLGGVTIGVATPVDRRGSCPDGGCYTTDDDWLRPSITSPCCPGGGARAALPLRSIRSRSPLGPSGRSQLRHWFCMTSFAPR